MEDNNEPVENIRRSNRYVIVTERKRMRDNNNDRYRCILFNVQDSIPLPICIQELADKMKSKSTLSVTDLRNLKNALLKDGVNIQIVLKTEGVLRGLVREISGPHWERQMEAAACLCNLALGDKRACLTIVKAAGAYLVAPLDSQNEDLAKNCAWTLGNLCGSGVEVSRLVSAAGAVARLCAMCARDVSAARAALYALTLYTYAMKHELSKEQAQLIVRSVTGERCPIDFRLHYNLTCHKDFSDHHLLHGHIIKHLPDILQLHRTCAGPDVCLLMFAIRALANMEGDAHFVKYLASIADEDPGLIAEFFALVEVAHLRPSMLWLLGNMQHLQACEVMVAGDLDDSTAPPPLRTGMIIKYDVPPLVRSAPTSFFPRSSSTGALELPHICDGYL